MISRRVKIGFAVWIALTAVFFMPEYGIYREQQQCFEHHRHVSVVRPVAYQDDGIGGFDPCFMDGPLPLWQQLAGLAWFGMTIVLPFAVGRDVFVFLRRKRAMRMSV